MTDTEPVSEKDDPIARAKRKADYARAMKPDFNAKILGERKKLIARYRANPSTFPSGPDGRAWGGEAWYKPEEWTDAGEYLPELKSKAKSKPESLSESPPESVPESPSESLADSPESPPSDSVDSVPDQTIINLFSQQLSIREIATRLKVSVGRVQRLKAKHALDKS